jgi:dephospho-CoA kinase
VSIVGLTGAPGAGKSLAAKYLKERGAVVLSGDDAGRMVVRDVPMVLRRLVNAFGISILKKDGTLDRRLLGRMVFGDPAAREKLNKIIHPHLLKALKTWIKQCQGRSPERLIVVDAALIFEWGIADWFDHILVVTAGRDLRIKRMMRAGLSRKEAADRISSQIPQRTKAALADYVIENNGSKSILRKKVGEFLDLLMQAEQTRDRK